MGYPVKKIITEQVQTVIQNGIVKKEDILKVFSQLIMDETQNPFVRLKAGELMLKALDAMPKEQNKYNGWVLVEPNKKIEE